MGRKGGGRKAFLKTAKPGEDEVEETHQIEPVNQSEVNTKAAVLEEDPSSRFLHEAPAAPLTSETPAKGDSSHDQSTKEETCANQQAQPQNETKGQLTQRHKKASMQPLKSTGLS